MLVVCFTTVLSTNQNLAEEEYEHLYGKVDPRCPMSDITVQPIHLQHAYNCKKFYTCYMGRAYLMDCPSGTAWDPTLNYCNDKRGLCPKPRIVQAQEEKKCPEIDDPKNPVHYPHPFECNLFFKCANGAGVLFECPPGLHFSVLTDRCERPEDAKCQIN